MYQKWGSWYQMEDFLYYDNDMVLNKHIHKILSHWCPITLFYRNLDSFDADFIVLDKMGAQSNFMHRKMIQKIG